MQRILPYSKNPFYWEYKNQAILLIGGSIEDNLFQIDDLEAHLDTLKVAGGNYVRCSMSSRDLNDVWPFEKDNSGIYNLEIAGKIYWQRFKQLLDLTFARDIIVQIEVWDRFDFAREPWQDNPFNPKNNTNYSTLDSALLESIASHPGEKENAFFRSVPALENNELLLNYQHNFVDALLECALPYGNVLYCIDNETNESPEWGVYWANYIKQKALAQNLSVQITEMWDAWDLSSKEHDATLNHPERYSFVDLSQNNHKVGLEHWQNPLKIRERIMRSGTVRPMNSVKIYGANTASYGSSRDAQERFWRLVLAGFASARFHRPPAGLGLSEVVQNHLKSMRMFLDKFDVFSSEPSLDLLSNRSWNEAYCAANVGHSYAVFFPDGGNVLLDVSTTGKSYELSWLDIRSSSWLAPQSIRSEGHVQLVSPSEEGYWLAVVTVKK